MLARSGPAPLRADAEAARRERLRVAVLVPPFARGSGGLTTILALVRTLAGRGHSCSLWLEDPHRRAPQRGRGVERRLREQFGPVPAEVHSGFSAWTGADVVVATGWETVARALLLPGCAARAYLVQDYEPDFFPASAEARWAERDLRAGPLPRHRRPVARRAPARALRRTRGVVRARRRPRALPPGRRASAATTPWSCTRAAQPRGGRCRSRCWRWPSSTAGAATCAWCCSGRSIRCAPRSPTSTPASCPNPSSPGSTARRPSGSHSRSPTTRA